MAASPFWVQAEHNALITVLPPAVGFDGATTLWEPEVPGEAAAAGEEAAAAAEQQQPGSGRHAAQRGSRVSRLPEPSGDQYAW